ncbi:hypothetical protein GUJ93_ZPchr0004g40137 [Zizania palustris]|uniref:Uncharacterized protein n=1 Tax=Zizania palustris TaxID=103762 RepID=A0A8J5VZP1_ZIZPA|nr:hypothetical protein GUJ93_ZPchr0004g40137 [Zizania palustris]
MAWTAGAVWGTSGWQGPSTTSATLHGGSNGSTLNVRSNGDVSCSCSSDVADARESTVGHCLLFDALHYVAAPISRHL